MIHDIYKIRHYECPCGLKLSEYRWGNMDPPVCTACQKFMSDVGYLKSNKAPSVHGDSIDIEVRHGICHDDGTPRRFTSKAELKRVAHEAGLSVYGDTPNPNQRIVEERQREKEEK